MKPISALWALQPIRSVVKTVYCLAKVARILINKLVYCVTTSSSIKVGLVQLSLVGLIVRSQIVKFKNTLTFFIRTTFDLVYLKRFCSLRSYLDTSTPFDSFSFDMHRKLKGHYNFLNILEKFYKFGIVGKPRPRGILETKIFWKKS